MKPRQPAQLMWTRHLVKMRQAWSAHSNVQFTNMY
jgi:hypothetical protein